MSSEKELILKLASLVEKQQKAIKKLAQSLPAQHLAPKLTEKDEVGVIWGRLDARSRAAIKSLKVRGNDLEVMFHPNKGSDQVFNYLVSTVNELVQTNDLPHALQVKEIV